MRLSWSRKRLDWGRKRLDWGRSRENGLWVAQKPLHRRRSRWRVMCRGHDALYAEAGWLRLRIMKRSRP
jgi:hypothetical protein